VNFHFKIAIMIIGIYAFSIVGGIYVVQYYEKEFIERCKRNDGNVEIQGKYLDRKVICTTKVETG